MKEAKHIESVPALRRFKKYSSYKDSGVKWLGNIPTHWGVKRLKTVALVQLSNVDKKSVEGQDVIRLCNYIDVYHHEHITRDLNFMTATATREQIRRFSLRAGDVLITKDSESWTDIAVPAVVTEDLPDVICGYHLAHIRPGDDCDGAFLSRAFAAIGLRDQFYIAANGITRYGLSSDAITASLVVMPPIAEQRSAAAFLDRETARIDALVAEKKRLIELLQEKRIALITRAVTKGLDPSAPMKDSGFEWLGKIPEHWNVKRLAWLLKDRPKNGVSPAIGPEGDTPTFSTAAVNDGIVEIEGNIKYTAMGSREARPFLVLKGDILLLRDSGSRALVGRAGIVRSEPPEGCIYPDILIRVRPVAFLAPWFLVSCLGSAAVRPQIESAAKTAAGIWKISGEDVRGLIIPVPPHAEQLRIETKVSQIIEKMDRAIAMIRGAIERLRELRTALISAAVTGNIDVRGEIA